MYVDVLCILCVYYFLKNTNTTIYGFLNWAPLARGPDSEKSTGFLNMASPGRETRQQDRMLKNTKHMHIKYVKHPPNTTHIILLVTNPIGLSRSF